MSAGQLRLLDGGQDGWRGEAAERFSEIVDRWELAAGEQNSAIIPIGERDAYLLALASGELQAYDREFDHPLGRCGWATHAALALNDLSAQLVATPN
jgi:hypothetical protein